MCLSVREQRVIQALAVCSTLKPLIWLAWMQSVSSPTYGTAEDTETFLEQTSSAAGGGVTQGKSCLSSWHLSRQTHYSPAGCSIQNHCEVRKKINYWRVCNQGNNRKSNHSPKQKKPTKWWSTLLDLASPTAIKLCSLFTENSFFKSPVRFNCIIKSIGWWAWSLWMWLKDMIKVCWIEKKKIFPTS